MAHQDWAAYLPLLLLAAVSATILVQVYLERRRRQELAQAAQELGLEFDPEPDLEGGLSRLRLFTLGRAGRPSNALKGRDEALLFDYSYTVGSGRHRRTHTQTVAAFRLGGGALPDFELRPEGLLHKLGSLFGYQDIDVEADPEFSRSYLLQGKDEAAVRQLFHPFVTGYFARNPGWSAEGGGEWIVVYRDGRQVPPQDLRSFLEETKGIRALMAR